MHVALMHYALHTCPVWVPGRYLLTYLLLFSFTLLDLPIFSFQNTPVLFPGRRS